ncbi:hypothetical protein KIN20_002222 [Parelaphostrongylus tenuis]|uniref:Uncharacterized protein n=1 Tax=Parelaphostrongylus tenuis TaxID=148309 RepID=A0AAD5QF53_PARTN|nr:hypothetical protein KIN20_002222 [Parelaphostrongylus tenuis]
MNQWMTEFVPDAKAHVLSQIHLPELTSELLPFDLLTVLATRLGDCPSLAVLLIIHEVQLEISSANIRNVMRCIGQYLDSMDSSKVRCAASHLFEEFTRDIDTVPDLLLLLDECGEIIESHSRVVLASKISHLIDEDVAASEYDVTQASIYRKLLTNYVMKTSEPGDCPSVDLKTVNSSCLVRYIDSLPSAVLNWELVSNLLDSVETNVIYTLKLVNRILCDPAKFHLHPRILGTVLQNEKMLQACEQFIPYFALILDCHYNTLMLADSHQVPACLDAASFLGSNNHIQYLGSFNIHHVDAGAFSATFFINLDLCNRHAQFLIDKFWRSFRDDPHEILTSLWKAVSLSIARNAQLLLLHNVLIIAGSPQRQTLSTRQEKGFIMAIYSIFSTMIYAVNSSNPDLARHIYDRINASKCLSSGDILLLSSARDDNDLTDGEEKSKIITLAVKTFITSGCANDIRVYHCSLFWQDLHRSLEIESRQWHSSDPLIKRKFF